MIDLWNLGLYIRYSIRGGALIKCFPQIYFFVSNTSYQDRRGHSEWNTINLKLAQNLKIGILVIIPS